METENVAEQLAQLIKQRDDIEERIYNLEKDLSLSMRVAGEKEFSHLGFKFVLTPESSSIKVDYREFYNLACQHTEIRVEILEEITSQCSPNKNRAEYLRVYRPKI